MAAGTVLNACNCAGVEAMPFAEAFIWRRPASNQSLRLDLCVRALDASNVVPRSAGSAAMTDARECGDNVDDDKVHRANEATGGCRHYSMGKCARMSSMTSSGRRCFGEYD